MNRTSSSPQLSFATAAGRLRASMINSAHAPPTPVISTLSFQSRSAAA